jgi:hypothetical protein
MRAFVNFSQNLINHHFWSAQWECSTNTKIPFKKKKKKKFFPKSMDNVQRSTGANSLFLPQTKEKLQCYPICSNYFTIPYSYFIVEKKKIFFYLLFFFLILI